MGAIIGAIVGYALGSRVGEQGWAEVQEAWSVIRTSEEIRDLVAAGVSITRGLLERGAEMLAGGAGNSESGAHLRPVA